MFEDSTFESYGRIHTRSRAWMIATCAFNGSILLAMILVPLIYPAVLPHAFKIFPLEIPTFKSPEPKPLTQVATTSTAPQEMRAGQIIFPTVIPPHPYIPLAQEVTRPFNIASDDLGAPDAAIFRSTEHRTEVRQTVRGPVRVPSTIQEGLLLHKTIPVYPPIARTSGIQGTVVLQATISRMGTIENLRVISGSMMLQQAAINAVQQWQYKPYLLNGEPVEVETTVNVIFKLN